MKTTVLFLSLLLLISTAAFTQVAINTSGASPDGSAMLDVTSNNRGVLFPRMLSGQVVSITNPAKGLMVYDSTLNKMVLNIGSPASPNWTSFSNGQYWSRTAGKTYLSNTSDAVGIGTTNPIHLLHLYESGTFSTLMLESDWNNPAGQAIFFANSGSLSAHCGLYMLTHDTLRATVMWNASGGYLTLHEDGADRLNIKNGHVGVNTINPLTNLHNYENNAQINPASRIEQDGSGDAAQHFYLTGEQSFSIGIDNSDSDNFRISSAANLGNISPPVYNEPTTMMRIHTENNQYGIIDFNHQSRARVFLKDSVQIIPPLVWTQINFDSANYDEHGEWAMNRPAGLSSFVATHEGYYQVNARTEFIYEEEGFGFCSIAIYKVGVMYSQGNNLHLTYFLQQGIEGENNNAPNVSDVVYLQAGQSIQIYVYHNDGFAGSLPIKKGSTQTYCSVHKIS